MLRAWAEDDIVARSASRWAGEAPWLCAENPAAASGMPGIHHLRGRAVRDTYQRFQAMRGRRVIRQGGWDCHGLAVEVAVERELGLSGARDIEAYGLERFAARCRESALRHVGEHSALVKRIGQWTSPGAGPHTMDPSCIEWVWSCISRIFEAGLLVRDCRVAPHCPRCQTPLAEHELAHPGASRSVAGTEVTVRFRTAEVAGQLSSWLRGADLLCQTAAPWSLVANAAIAVHPHQAYAVARRAGHDDLVVVAESAVARVLGDDWHVAARVSGADLAGGVSYWPPFGGPGAGPHRVIGGYFVTTAAGTGLQPVAPAFGADDLAAAHAHGIPVTFPITPDGRFERSLPLVGGVFFADADPILTEALAERGLLLRSRPQERSRQHCWRCGTPLISRAAPAWYIRTSAIEDQLLAEDARSSWIPAPASRGSGGDWLRCEADWLVSRTRYWGTPLPLWECPDGHVTCVPSLARLSELAGTDVTGLDPHRPGIDLITIACPRCGGRARRVSEVCDSALDCAALPFMPPGWPASDPAASAAEPGAGRHQARLVAESADEAASWFYALLTLGTMLTGRSGFATALCVGPVLDDSGAPMDRGHGNVAAPLPLVERYGADAVRWLLTAATAPSAATRVTETALEDVARNVLRRYWSAVAFFAGCTGTPGGPAAPPPGARPALDRWLLGELQSLAGDVTTSFESYRSAAAGRRIQGFTDDLTTWYLRRSRRRFMDGGRTADGAAAMATLRACLAVLTRLMAPITPFLTDYAWRAIRLDDEPESVHLTDWPVPEGQLSDLRLADQMALARRLARLGRSVRAAAMIRWRQPLATAVVSADNFAALGGELRELVAEALNVRAVQPAPAGAAVTRLAAMDGTARWAAASEGADALALDVQVTPELHREGLAREVVGLIRRARRADGIGPADRISLRWSAPDSELAAALAEHAAMIGAETLAAEYGAGIAERRQDGPGDREHHSAELGLTFWIGPLPQSPGGAADRP